MLDEDGIEAKDKHRFDWRQRTVHHDIPPAKIRIEDVKRKDLGEKYNEVAQRSINQRPKTSTQQNAVSQ